MPLTLYKTFAWQTFASLRLFTCLVYVSSYCVPISLLRQNKPFRLVYLGHAQITSDVQDRLETAYRDMRQSLQVAQRREKDAYDKGVKHVPFQTGDLVLHNIHSTAEVR